MDEFANRFCKYYIGIDPGKGGAIAIISDAARIIKTICFDKPTPHEIQNTFEAYTQQPNAFGILEHVHAMPVERKGSNGKTIRQGATSLFTFGQYFGIAQMLLVCNGVPFEEISPAKWQKEFIVKKPKEPQAEHKRRLKRKAQMLFPSQTKLITNKTADAILLAEYCRRNYREQF